MIFFTFLIQSCFSYSGFLDCSSFVTKDQINEFAKSVKKMKDPILVIGEQLSHPHSLKRFPPKQFVFLDPSPQVAEKLFFQVECKSAKACGIAGFISNLTLLNDTLKFSYIIDDIGVMSGFVKYGDYIDDGLEPAERLRILSSVLSDDGVITTGIGFCSACISVKMQDNGRCEGFDVRIGNTRHMAKPFMDVSRNFKAQFFPPSLPPWSKPDFDDLGGVNGDISRITVIFNDLYHHPLNEIATFRANKPKYQLIPNLGKQLGINVGSISTHEYLRDISRIMKKKYDADTMFEGLVARMDEEPEVKKCVSAFDKVSKTPGHTEAQTEEALGCMFELAYGTREVYESPIRTCYDLLEEEIRNVYGEGIPGDDTKHGPMPLYDLLDVVSLFMKKNGGGEKEI